MTLTFTQSSDQSFGGVPAYEAEFEVTSNFAIHIERTRGDAALILKQRTGGGKYALVDDFNYAKSKGEVLDYEASVTIPKFIKIVSEVEPTLAEIVTDGEVTEIKAQAKEIEVTTNGTTEVVPDSGFAYLSKVNIKTNVPQNGEGGGSTGGNGVEYFAFGEGTVQALAAYAQYFKIESTSMGFKAVAPYSVAMSELIAASNAEMLAIGINLSERMLTKQGDVVHQGTALESLQMNGVTQEQIDALPRITEEEFYNLNA